MDITEATIKGILELQDNKQELKEMARVGFLRDKKRKDKETKYEVYVNTEDGGDKPHFHLRYDTDWDKFHTCIRIDCCEYFEHEGKEDKLDSNMRKQLVQFLKMENEDDETKTNWDIVVIEWNRNNSKRKVDKNIEMPNYLLLK